MATKRKIRFALSARFPESLKAWQDYCRKVEDLGFDVLLMGDHMQQHWAPLIAIQAGADATTTLHFGTQVIANEFRNPSLLAKEVATLNLLTGGRYEMGIGTGWPAASPTGRADSLATGLDFGENGPRVSKLVEALHIIKTYLTTKEPFDYEGKFYNVHGLTPYPPCETPPRIMLAGGGPRMLKLAAREADIVNIAPRPPTVGPTPRGSLGFGLTIHDELAIIKEAAGDRYDSLELGVFADNAAVTNDRAAGVEKYAASMNTTPAMVEEMAATLIGTHDEIVDAIERHREQYDITYRIVPHYLLDDIAPVVKRLAGT
jgi:probable F420-dependent oxidoreductase